MRVIKVQVDWRYIGDKDNYCFQNKNGIIESSPIGKYCAILKHYKSDGFYMDEKWGFLKNVLFSIEVGEPIDFDGDVMRDCYLIKIEGVL